MVTESNIAKARESYEKAKAEHDKRKLFYDALLTYINEWGAGVWMDDASLPAEGPFTVNQAKELDIVIPSDHSMPAVYRQPAIYERATTIFPEVEEELNRLHAEMTKKRETLEDMENQRVEDLERAQKLAETDPRVVAANENADAVKAELKAKMENARLRAEERAANRRLVVTGLVGLFVVTVLIVVVAKVIK